LTIKNIICNGKIKAFKTFKEIIMLKLCFIDVETTGLDCKQHEIHQLSGIIDIDGIVKETFNFKIKPSKNCKYQDEALKLNNLTIESLQNDPTRISIGVAYTQLINIFSKYVSKFDKMDKFYFVGYNANFDKDFCYEFFTQNNDKYFFSWMWSNHIDVMVLATMTLIHKRKQMPNFKLISVIKEINIEVNEEHLHDSEYDIYLTRELYYKIEKVNTQTKKQSNKMIKSETEKQDKKIKYDLLTN
jgi:DNA polymerase-3 subunit epsilon